MKAVSSERLIELVREHPAIWNPKCSGYQKPQKREEAWGKVAAQYAGDNWYGMSPDEQNQLLLTIKSRWRNIRDNYKKYFKTRNRKVDGPRKYYCADMLTFLVEDEGAETEQSSSEQREEDPLLSEESNSESGSKRFKMSTSDDIDLAPFVKIENWTEMEEFDEEPLTSNSLDPHTQTVQPTKIETHTSHMNILQHQTATTSVERPEAEPSNLSRKNTLNGPDEFEREILRILKIKVDTPGTSAITPAIMSDPDAMFFLSQMPYVKSLSSADRMDFRIKFMQLLQSYINNSSTSSSNKAK